QIVDALTHVQQFLNVQCAASPVNFHGTESTIQPGFFMRVGRQSPYPFARSGRVSVSSGRAASLLYMARIPMLGAPTASGKSSIALQLAREFPLEIVTADAMQVYRGMDIGTAKPTAEERAMVPHHLIDLVTPA